MSRIYYFIISFLLICQSSSLIAQFDNLQIERINANDGLPNCIINDAIEDHYGFLWFATIEGLFRYDGYEFKAYRHDVTDSMSLTNPSILSVLEDNKGNIWAGSNNGLNLLDRRTGKVQRFKPSPDNKTTKILNQARTLFIDSSENLLVASSRAVLKFDKEQKKFVDLFQKDQKDKRHYVRSFAKDNYGNIWAGTSKGLLKLDVEKNSLQYILPDLDSKSNFNRSINAIIPISDSTLLLGTRGGLIQWNIFTNTIDNSILPKPYRKLPIDFLLRDKASNLWISFTNKGLGVYNFEQDKFNHFQYQANQINSLSSNKVDCILEDRFKNIWVCTANGLCKIKIDNSGFSLYQNKKGYDNNANHVNRVFQDSRGAIWSNTPEGVFRIAAEENKGTPVDIIPTKESYTVGTWFLEDPRGGLWTSVNRKGIYYQAPGAKSFQKKLLGDTLERALVYKVLLDPIEANIAWLGTSSGLCKLNLLTSKRQWYIPSNDIPNVASNKVSVFEQFGENEIWLYYTYFNSMGRFDKKTGKFEQFRPTPDKQKMLEGAVKDIVISSDGNIWLATTFGLTNFDIHTHEFKIYNKRDGLTESELITVILDQKEKIWICGNRFLSSFDHKKKIFQNFSITDEVKNFLSKSRFLGKDGRIFLGNLAGVYTFHPDEITKNQIVPEIILTDFKVRNESYLLEKSFEDTRDIILSYDENDLTFDFAGLHFIHPETNQYKCKLEGYNDTWQELGKEHRAIYANLNHGNYVFRVMAANSDGVWNEEGLRINLMITPAFWQTVWFKTLVFLVLLSIGYALYKNRQNQLKLQRQKELAEQSAEYKSRFLADISHEIRTPMNAIIGLSKLTLGTPLDQKQSKFVSAIKQSSLNLLTIINDLLDHTKLEAGKFTFVKKQFDLKEIILQLQDTLAHKAQEKQLTFDLDLDSELPQKVLGDPVRLNQILTNLLGNALKFTNQGRIWLSVKKIKETTQSAEIYFEVGDTGIGIAKNQIDSIFESYTQAENNLMTEQEGTGLGLPIAKQLVEKQGGKLLLKSTLGKGTKLEFTLPFSKPRVEKNPEQIDNQQYHFGHLEILVVEDTYFNQLFIVELLKKKIKNVQIDLAENGKIAFERLEKKSYDLILMDVKMPVMNGFEVTRIIRKSKDPRIKDIPILGVTASAIPTQLQECIDAGMDDYVTKPINGEQLIKKMHSLLYQETKT